MSEVPLYRSYCKNLDWIPCSSEGPCPAAPRRICISGMYFVCISPPVSDRPCSDIYFGYVFPPDRSLTSWLHLGESGKFPFHLSSSRYNVSPVATFATVVGLSPGRNVATHRTLQRNCPPLIMPSAARSYPTRTSIRGKPHLGLEDPQTRAVKPFPISRCAPSRS